MPISNYVPDYDGNKRFIISEENNRKHVGKNLGECRITHYKIDGVIFINETTCDYILINEDKKFAYLIELKGCGIDKAAEQLEATSDKLSKYLRDYNIRFRIIASNVPSRKSRTHGVNSSSYKLLSLWGKNNLLVMSTNTLEENI